MTLDRCVELSLAQLDPGTRARFAADPLGVLSTELLLKVKAVPQLAQQRADGGACDGMSYLQDGVILYAPTPYSRRENFTLAHEFGHYLVNQNDEVLDWLADQDHTEELLETVCDRVAQHLLLPSSLIDSVLDTQPTRASDVTRLYEATQASRPVCAIAVASKLSHLGAVVIIDRPSQAVCYGSVRPDPDQPWPTVFPWPGQRVPPGHPLNNMHRDMSLTRKTFWETTWGKRADFYIDAISDARRTIAVFSDVDVWGSETLHLDSEREIDQRPAAEIYCCGSTQTVRGYPCDTCHQPHCPKCRYCRCERAALKEQMCTGGCYMKFQPNLLVNGLCEDCQP
ncbi:ImmA/IrrE family metallo-endopeptidase [Nocardia sp. CA-135398]|uniref:ImmA/IrrE family metallo-endopeptidase n=1 Tax=Nocardia sp. CA-135398 TaxID=3239977 RepID=UPI003D99ECB7